MRNHRLFRRLLVAALLSTAAFLTTAAGASDTEANKAMFKKFMDEVINKGNMAMIDEFLSEDFVEHEPMPPGIPEGREGCKAFFTMYREAFPDAKMTIDDMIAEGDKVVARQTWTGTNKGAFMGMPATGNQVKFDVIDIVRMKDGKAVEHWGVYDGATMMQQLHPESMKMMHEGGEGH